MASFPFDKSNRILLYHLGRLALDSAGIPAFTSCHSVDGDVLGDRLRLGGRVPRFTAEDLSVSSDQEKRQDHEERETAEEG